MKFVLNKIQADLLRRGLKIYILGEGAWTAVGVVSWRNAAGSPGGGCQGDTFTIFTEIAEYLDWIADEMDLLPPIQ